VVVDPSHAAGDWRKIAPLSRAALAAGADGLLIEVHAHPERALSDGQQALTPARFERLMDDVRRLAPVVGRTTRILAEPAR
jgi:3-deoxy-7-phosphoheptulonate synthase